VLAWPLASLETCPRDPLGGAALGQMKPVDEPDEETTSSPAERMAPMRRAPGGRTRVIYVRVTEEEDREIRRRAVKHRRSAQRFLIETALSGRHGCLQSEAGRNGMRRWHGLGWPGWPTM